MFRRWIWSNLFLQLLLMHVISSSVILKCFAWFSNVAPDLHFGKKPSAILTFVLPGLTAFDPLTSRSIQMFTSTRTTKPRRHFPTPLILIADLLVLPSFCVKSPPAPLPSRSQSCCLGGCHSAWGILLRRAYLSVSTLDSERIGTSVFVAEEVCY